MNTPLRTRSLLLFVGLPALWLGSFTITERISLSEQLASYFQFVPVSIHASHFADYSPDTIINSFAPVDEDIVSDAQADQGLAPTIPLIQPVTLTPTPTPKDDSHQESGGQSTPAPNDPGQSQSGDNGNKDKDAESPGQSGEEHGNGGGQPVKPTKTPKPPK